MRTEDLANRMHVAQSTVTRLEKSERAHTIRLDTLARAAEAMDCDLVYALVPRRPLDNVIDEQAGRKAMEKLRRLGHTMALEEQALDDDKLRRSFLLFRDVAMHSPGLWNETEGPGESSSSGPATQG